MVRLLNTDNHLADGEGAYEIAEEARPAEELKLGESLIKAHALHTEYSYLCQNSIDGIYVIPSASDPYKWFGLMFIRSGEYVGSIFRFRILIPHDFPDTVKIPVVQFDLDIFHPDIDMKTRKLSMSRYFPDGWKRDKHHVVNVLKVVQRIFFSLDIPVESAANPEAAILWKEQRPKFKEMASACVNLSRVQVYEDPIDNEDTNALSVTPWDSSLHEPIRQRMMLLGSGRSTDSGAWSERGKRNGLSWVDTDRMTYMTEPVAHHGVDDSIQKAAADRVAHGIERLDLSAVNGDCADAEEDESVKKADAEEQQSPSPTTDQCHAKLKRAESVEKKEAVTEGENVEQFADV